MATTLIIPDDAIRSHKCYLCENILSVPPIMVISLELEQYKCGRCKDVKYTSYTRNTLFENIARFIWLPCTYNGCTEKIPWGLAEKHEKQCLFRTIHCPIYYQKCDDVIQAAELESHFKEKHKNNTKICKEVWDLNTKFDYVFLITAGNQQFLVYVLHLNDLFSMGVLSIDPIDKYKKYTVKISTGSEGEGSILYENQRIIQFDERQHCYKCIRGCCQSKYHPYSQRNKKSDMNVNKFTTKFRKELITSLSQHNGDIKYTVNLIVEKPEQERNDETKAESTETNKTDQTTSKDARVRHDLIRKSIECPICEEYMVAPIFSCKTGHTICNLCKPRLKKCPTCEANLSDARNFTLEELTENIKLHCQHEDNGCNFIGNTAQMYKHELDCSYKIKI